MALFLADYTSFPPDMSAELERYGRAGVPMVLVFPKDMSQPALVVPETILPNTQAANILKALDAASK